MEMSAVAESRLSDVSKSAWSRRQLPLQHGAAGALLLDSTTEAHLVGGLTTLLMALA